MQNMTHAARAALAGIGRAAVHALYPPQCVCCAELVAEDGHLCPSCWREMPFIDGLCCDSCGLPLPGSDPGHAVHCDECMLLARPWDQGRAALLYGEAARKLLLGLKYYDRLDQIPPAARWMARAAAPILRPGMLIVPIPLHWTRLLKRRYNQAAELSGALARLQGMDHCPDLLRRVRATGTQDGRGRMGRFTNMQDAFAPHPRRAKRLDGRDILLVDDVMTAGATFAAAAECCLAHGAASVRVVALARVARAQ
jgi:ComF family protein